MDKAQLLREQLKRRQEYMNNNYTHIDLLKRIVEIPSISGQEEVLADFLQQYMSSLGYNSTLDEAGNLIVEKGDLDAPLILLLGHMDTVAPYTNVQEKDGKLYGRGSVDAKGALATFISAFHQVEMDCRLIIVGAVEEEVSSSKGANYILHHYNPDAVIIGEPSGCSNIVVGYKGKIGIHYSIENLSSHSAGNGDKSTMLAYNFWNQLNEFINKNASSAFYDPTATITNIEGTMEKCSMDISIRIPPEYDIEALKQFVFSIQDQATISFSEVTPAVLKKRDSTVARALLSAIREFSLQPKVKVKTGTSDMNIVNTKWSNIPMIAYGPGDSMLDHTPNEHLELKEYELAIQILKLGLENLSNELIESNQDVFSAEDEEEITQRLQALGYID
ncbi:M20/M25/M40 family metallo-hydrolase [Paenibacillus nicotianae]|uniref:M20/M25/M40 family metallo-hydrolase n=1 Tax=Paenibacillus nicotianae TaxID=1526551 RepID=A0ABW4USD3_9BACL